MRRKWRYGVSAVERIFEKMQDGLVQDCEKLRYQTAFYVYSLDELMQESRLLFFKNFAGYFENQKQYRRFLFISLKNRIRTLQRIEYTYHNRFKGHTNSDWDQEVISYDEQFKHIPDNKSTGKATTALLENQFLRTVFAKTQHKTVIEFLEHVCKTGKKLDDALDEFEEQEQIKKEILSAF